LIEIFNANRDRIARNLEAFAKHRPFFDGIPNENTNSELPFWDNGWLPPLDGVALYGFLASRNPARYVEIGSGHSTRFARKAINDQLLRTEITSIDPRPRAQIDALCDHCIRVPFENVNQEFFGALESGDIVFFDGSHRCFTNSDVTVFFLDVLPALKPGVLVHVHDIYLPCDYPPNTPYYSEQYLLAAYVLAGAPLDIEMPNAFVTNDAELQKLAQRCLPQERAARPSTATGFWFSKRR